MNHKEILNKYTHPYGEIFKPKMIEFVREVIKKMTIYLMYTGQIYSIMVKWSNSCKIITLKQLKMN